MQKSGRYLLIFLTLAASVCLVATAAGIYMVGPGLGYAGWAAGVNVGATHRAFFTFYSTMRLGYDSHEVSVPISWSGFVLLILALPALVCTIAASLLARPLFTTTVREDEHSGTDSTAASKEPSGPGSRHE